MDVLKVFAGNKKYFVHTEPAFFHLAVSPPRHELERLLQLDLALLAALQEGHLQQDQRIKIMLMITLTIMMINLYLLPPVVV